MIRLTHIYLRFFFLMLRPPPLSTRTDTLFPYTTLFRSGVADQEGSGRRPFLAEIAVIGLGRESDVEAAIVEGLARVEVDRAGKAALDQVGGGVLVDLDRPEQFGRHVGEVDRLSTDTGGKGVAAVEFRAHEVEAADDDARALDREMVGVVGAREAVDRDARNALQRFGDRTVGQRADVLDRKSTRLNSSH